MAWLKRQGIAGPVEVVSPAEVSRLTEAAWTQTMRLVAGSGQKKKRPAPPDVPAWTRGRLKRSLSPPSIMIIPRRSGFKPVP